MRVPGLRRTTSDADPTPDHPHDDAAPAAVVVRPAVADPAVVADAVSAAVLAVPGVVALHAGPFGTVATYLPGRRVIGVRLRPGAGEVHVVLHEHADVLRTAARVHAAAEPLAGGPVHVVVEDLATS